ncbi:RNA polymerase sigma-70 factor (ECF subfamily) [Ancylomarina subtilis]|uniref:RNA polymerase sigma-70 factor (ECF subfamily) n=1 Tax=Ancylomarina subtilis TaxID=1639035 RepID=A0A4V2FRP6_9BACT|nr:sigma-70 family RNA polymerase sigma factor [Ancylomarina subtilis]RZT91219.1 RNA polymerase sigma-70 factor (ECF subfamily) [Ancylomarina subtilis]
MNQDHFKYLFDTYFDAIRNYLYFRSGDSDLATDIAQECFMRVWEKRKSFKDPPTKALLYKIANDFFISRYRKDVVAQNYIANARQNDQMESPEEILQYKELRCKYELALSQLSEKQRIVFLMSRTEGFKYSEIAERLNLSVKAVEKRMKHALHFLKEALKNESIYK